jgi:hypothetical protein
MIKDYPDIEIKYADLYEHLNSLCKTNFDENIKDKLNEVLDKKQALEKNIKDIDAILFESDKEIKKILNESH